MAAINASWKWLSRRSRVGIGCSCTKCEYRVCSREFHRTSASEVLTHLLHRHTLGQISGLVNIRAPCTCRVVGQQLQRNGVQDG